MKKIKVYPFLFIFTLLLSFFYVPLPSVKSANNWDNFIDFVRTNLGFVSVNNGTLSGMSRDDFYDSLYNTPLVWSDNGQDFSFTPVNEFTRGEWTQVCKVGSSDDTRFNNFNIQDCLIKSDYIKDNGSGYDLSAFPTLSGTANAVNPLDGVIVKTNFSDFNPHFEVSANPVYAESLFNSIKNMYLSQFDNLYIVSGYPLSPYNGINNYFISLNDYYDFICLFTNSDGYINGNGYYFHNSNGWFQSSFASSSYKTSNSINRKDNYDYYYGNDSLARYLNIISTTPSSLELSNTYNGSYSIKMQIVSIYNNVSASVWGNSPIVIASSITAAQNYYYWLKGVPSGGIYTTANATDTIYNYEYVNNNNWETAYNNYITDVSNYYSTTENITNEQLTQYIDNSTTITNITNNYITNSGGESDEDNLITNSWLERIYNKILEIIAILKGESVSESGDTYITDNSVKNEIVEYPSSDLFPDVPLDNFIDSSEDFTIDLFSSKLSAVISEAIPFCYIGILGRVSETLSASPTAPYWEIPFVIDRLNIHESLVLDLTSSDWDNVHNVWIACFLIFFVSFLFYLTYRIVLLVSSLFA